MREIKFRAYILGKMYEVSYLDWTSDGLVVETDAGWMTLPDENVALMQYTGLKDKNGKEIYEGDIFHWIFDKQLLMDTELYVAALDDPPYNLVDNVSVVKVVGGNTILETDGGEFTALLKGEFDRSQMGEVIGNIYESKELLEG